MIVYKKFLAVVMASLSIALLLPVVAMAHVAVQPSETGIGKTQVFTISVPTEKDVPTVGVRIVLPAGLQEVIPTVNPGWQIQTKTSGEGDNQEVQEISWAGGSIPAGQRNEFSFSAQVPSKPTTLSWKAYQTYQDGSVVSWDQTPNGSDDASGDKGPYSTTKVIDDLQSNDTKNQTSLAGPYILAGLALVVALVALLRKSK